MTPRRVLTTVVTAVAIAASAALVGVADPAPADAQDGPRVIEVTGRGWGHGRGLGQYGAYGYAAEQGWNSTQILDHFYGGTSNGQPPPNGPVWPLGIRVDLRSLRGQTTTVALEEGAIDLRGLDEAPLGRFGDGAVRLRWNGSAFLVDSGPSCDGPWTLIGDIGGRTTVRLQADSSGTGSSGLLQACGSGNRTWYDGELRAVVDNGQTRTVNVVTVEQYLRGVVPNEMPASWPAAALQAQAVAARSYALAGDGRQQPYADTCDTTLCQVYDGRYTTRGGSFRTASHENTDLAILATANTVRLAGNGSVARTEFSSSTGGHTAGGTFPPVVDAGDSIAANRNHNWAVTVEVAALEQRYGKGELQSIEVTNRNGLGADGGRVTSVELRFARGTVTESGSTLRSRLGLKSDWFTPGPVFVPGQRTSSAGTYIDRSYQRLVGRTASDAEIARWHAAVARGDRLALTGLLVRSDYFLGRIADDLYQRALERPADGDGRGYWILKMNGGLKVEHIGVLFYGSREYFLRSGGTSSTFVSELYRDILDREPDAGGLAYWVGQLDNGRARTDDVAAGFYRSLESRRTRAASLHLQVRGTAVSESGVVALAERLRLADDLVVAAEIAASPEA